jgi:alkylation response protein AidB-like acyl-CoA dehydrogenase
MPHVDDWEEAKWMPKEIYQEWGRKGLLAFAQAPEIYEHLPKDFPIPAGLTPETIDPFHKMVARFEYARMGSSGVNSGLFSGINIAMPPLMFFGTEDMKKRVIPDIVTGGNWCCLAITEPTSGSDTANISTSAVLSDDGKHYIVNGTKKWITNGGGIERSECIQHVC